MSNESTLGAYLRRCRERSGLSLEAVSSASRIVPGLVRSPVVHATIPDEPRP